MSRELNMAQGMYNALKINEVSELIEVEKRMTELEKRFK